MNVFSASVSAFATRIGARPWTCSTCRNQLVRSKPFQHVGARRFASGRGSRGGNGRGGRPGRVVLYASTGTATIAAGALAFTEDIKNGYEAAERTGRVAAALAICINEYAVDQPFGAWTLG